MNRSLDVLYHEHSNSIFCFILSATFLLLGVISSLGAAIIQTGNVEPAGTWTTSTNGYVGKISDGSILVNAGSLLQSKYAYMAYNSGVSGSATVTGTNTKWTNGNDCYVGYNGIGTLSIEAGGQVSDYSSYIGFNAGSSGSATVTGTNSKWINTNYCVVGYNGIGRLSIETGGQVSSSSSSFGANSGSSGSATVTGAGSNWAISNPLYVGEFGYGTLLIDAGGQVNSSGGYLGYRPGSSGSATVTGAGSKWINSFQICVGGEGTGTLIVADGGEVIAKTLYASLSSLFGNGTISTQGAVLDADLRFDSTHPSQASFSFGSGGTMTISPGTGDLGAGFKGIGSLTVAEGVVTKSSNGYLGYYAGSSGTALVTGPGSKWNNSYDLYVGREGTGTLTVANGGEVTAQTLYASLSSLFGNGTISTQGAVLDADLRFDSTHPSQASFSFGSGGTMTISPGAGNLGAGFKGNGSLTVAEGVAINSLSGYLGDYLGSSGTALITGAGSMWTNNGYLYVGQFGNGTIHIESGGQVSDFYGYIGCFNGSSGTATVTGAGSKWTNSYFFSVGLYGTGTLRIEAGGQVNTKTGILGDYPGSCGTATVTGPGSKLAISDYFYVGQSGSATLRIEAGGQVSNYNSYVGCQSGSSGTVVVSGSGSMWTNGSLYIGTSGNGTVHVRGGGVITANSVSIMSSHSLLTFDVGSNSKLQTATITNHGTLRVLAGPQAAAGSRCVPIDWSTWIGSGAQALGGTWDDAFHVFTVSQTVIGASGKPMALDLMQRQRLLVEEGTKDWTIGASVIRQSNGINLTATAVAGTDLTTLMGLLKPGQFVLNGWNFTVTGGGYDASYPIFLSLGIPVSLTYDNLQLWRLNGNTWSRFAADDLTAKDGYASFTVTGFNGYAVSAFLPAWNVDADGHWKDGLNWSTNPIAPTGVNTTAVLGPSITAPRMITLDEPLTLGMLLFDSAQHYTLSGTQPLKFEVNPGSTAKINVQDSDMQGNIIETPIILASPLKITLAPLSSLTLTGQVQNPTGQTMTLSGGGTLTVTQGIVTTGVVNVQTGTLITPSLNAGTLSIGQSVSIAAAVPEPSMWVLLMACVVGGYIMARASFR